MSEFTANLALAETAQNSRYALNVGRHALVVRPTVAPRRAGLLVRLVRALIGA